MFGDSEIVCATRGPNLTNEELDGNCDGNMPEQGLENRCS